MHSREKYRMLLSETLSLDGSASYPQVIFLFVLLWVFFPLFWEGEGKEGEERVE